MNFGKKVNIWYVMNDGGDGSGSATFFSSEEEAKKYLDYCEEEYGSETTWMNEGEVNQVRVYDSLQEYLKD